MLNTMSHAMQQHFGVAFLALIGLTFAPAVLIAVAGHALIGAGGAMSLAVMSAAFGSMAWQHLLERNTCSTQR